MDKVKIKKIKNGFKISNFQEYNYLLIISKNKKNNNNKEESKSN